MTLHQWRAWLETYLMTNRVVDVLLVEAILRDWQERETVLTAPEPALLDAVRAAGEEA